MTNILIILFILFVSFHTQKNLLYNNQGKPSTYGITQYVEKNQESIVKEYEYQIDTIYDVYIFTESLGENINQDLGHFYLPDYIVITDRESYVAYEFKELSKFKQRTVSYNERTVKAVIFHELTHVYFNQILVLMQNNEKNVSPEYGTLRMFPNPASRFGATFIEEGVCEYVVYYLKECSDIKDVAIPQTKEDLTDDMNIVNNMYRYSVMFVKDFLDTCGLKKGIEILIGNKPPTYEEILDPKLFFNRINYTYNERKN